MTSQQNFPFIFASDGTPFADFKRASFMRDQLNAIAPEYGFVIVEHADGGFVLQQSRDAKKDVQAQMASVVGQSQNQQASTQSNTDPLTKVSEETRRFVGGLPMIIRPALRNFIFRWAFSLVLLVLALKIEDIVVSLVPQKWLVYAVHYVPQFFTILFSLFLVLAVYHMLVIIGRVYSNTYTIYKDGVKGRSGIVSRDAHTIKFRDVRGVGLEQGLFDRLLGVGTIEFYTAGSDGADVVFHNVANAVVIRDYLDEYASQFR